jgi:hypothetical protein
MRDKTDNNYRLSLDFEWSIATSLKYFHLWETGADHIVCHQDHHCPNIISGENTSMLKYLGLGWTVMSMTADSVVHAAVFSTPV